MLVSGEQVRWIALNRFQTNNSSNVFVCRRSSDRQILSFWLRITFCCIEHERFKVFLQVLVLNNFSVSALISSQPAGFVPGSHVDGLNVVQVMKLGYQETGISTKDVVFAQVLDLFRRDAKNGYP